MDKRYFIDERVGCIAVMDRDLIDPDYQGLSRDTAGVIEYWSGTPIIHVCPTCGHKEQRGWSISSQKQAIKANELCDKLNREEARDG